MTTQTSYDSIVNSFYLAYYGRPADPAGLKFWSQQLEKADGDFKVIAADFATSEEAQTRFGSDSAADRITEIYQQLFNRAPDAEGLAYWMSTIENGNASVGSVAIAILDGAKGTDSDLVDLRKQAMDAFTAQVDTTGSDYAGYAAVEAARILVRAVTLDTTAGDMDTLVKSAVSFAATATKTPAVVDAIATGTTLLALFDTTRGKADPVALAQTLADTAKAAAGNPVTLDSLLRGGGMDKVLKVMPADATLTDVVKALASGGLPAAVEVVYPTKPTAPVETSPAHPVDPTPANPNPPLPEQSPKVTLEADADGLHVTSSQSGSMIVARGIDAQIGTPVYTAEKGGALVGTVVVGEQELAASGQLLVQGVSGIGTDAAKTAVALGTAQQDFLSGKYVWGFGGNDYISGTTGNDKLYGGDGQDNITGNAGADLIVGGSGADRIVINAGLDQVTGKFTSDSTFDASASGAVLGGGHGQDTIDGFEFGSDVVMLAASQVSSFDYHHAVAMGGTQAGTAVYADNVVAVDLDNDGRYDEVAINFTNASKEVNLENVSDAIQYFIDGTSGNDTIVTGSQNDVVRTGAGNDTISVGAGADSVVAGAGADRIDLGNDDARDVVEFERGDTATGIFADGASTAEMDVIVNARAGDAIGLAANIITAAATAHSTYLADATTNNYAVVRGSDAGGVFVAGDATTDNDYMVQWADGRAVNSIILEDYGTHAPEFDIIGAFGDMTLKAVPNEPVVVAEKATMVSATFQSFMDNDGMAIALESTPDHIVDFMPDQQMAISGPTLQSASLTGGMPYGYDFFELQSYSLYKNVLYMHDQLPIDLYGLSWTDKTFLTDGASGSGYVAGGTALLAGGYSNGVSVSGFALKDAWTVYGEVSDGNLQEGIAYIVGKDSAAHITTGSGMDVVVAGEGAAVTVAYDKLDTSGQDLILGFGNADQIEFGGDAAFQIDHNHDNVLNYLDMEDGQRPLQASDELVIFRNNSGPISNVLTGFDGAVTVSALSENLDVSNLKSGDSTLILVNEPSGGAGILFQYVEHGGNGQIDIQDLTVVASFANGTLTSGAITLVGVAEESQGISG